MKHQSLGLNFGNFCSSNNTIKKKGEQDEVENPIMVTRVSHNKAINRKYSLLNLSGEIESK